MGLEAILIHHSSRQLYHTVHQIYNIAVIYRCTPCHVRTAATTSTAAAVIHTAMRSIVITIYIFIACVVVGMAAAIMWCSS